MHVKADRVDAGIASYETLIEEARKSAARVKSAAILQSKNGRRVIVLAELHGHDGYRHLAAAWDDHHLLAEHHAIAESHANALYRVIESPGVPVIEPGAHDVYAFELVAKPLRPMHELLKPLSEAAGFRGGVVFGADVAPAAAVLYRFSHAEEIEAFRETAPASSILGRAHADGEVFYAVRIVKTYLG